MNKSGHGDTSIVIDLLKDAARKNLISYFQTRSGYMIKSKVDDSQEAIHKGERAFHYARRYINRVSNNLNDLTGQKSLSPYIAKGLVSENPSHRIRISTARTGKRWE